MIFEKVKLSDLISDEREELARLERSLLSGRRIELTEILDEIQNFLPIYPSVIDWFKKTVYELVFYKTREVIVLLDFDHNSDKVKVLGLVILKKTKDEKKICAIRLDEALKGKGLGTHLFESAFRYLETDKPVITIDEGKVEEFSGIFKKFGFELSHTVENEYFEGQTEYHYNDWANAPK